MSLLSVSGLHAAYGPIRALSGVDLSVAEGEIVALIGANGAGKSTLLMTICGNPRAAQGRILFAERDITRLPTHEIARLGIAQVPEGRRIFPRMTVLENLMMGAAGRDGRPSDQDYGLVFDLFPLLAERKGQRAGKSCLTRCSAISRCSASGAIRRAAPCRAVSNRCWRSAVR
jgi:branched-chain amino acid transport system ATP-binding protein